MKTDVLVIGTGVAGLSCALKIAAHAQVVVITKKQHTESNTNYAQGGIAAAVGPDDSPDLHLEDTCTAGAGLCHRDAVMQVVKEGPARIRELMEWGARFNEEPDEEGNLHLALGREGGHPRRRIIHARDLTGREVERALVTAVEKHANIQVLEYHAAIDFLMGTEDSVPAVLGATVLDSRADRSQVFEARVTVLASGGLGHVYLHTTNPVIATGDGVGMAWRAGAQIANMEFIQFHPTSLFHPEARSFLISEAVRGEGGILRLQDGTPFMDEYHPQASLAPRDVVARAIDNELKRSGDDYVLLDVTHLDADFLRERFPTIYERCMDLGFDITKELIPVVPAAHYSCGGVLTDLHARTSLRRLFAVGEVACTGVHGANRLASNSLLEALVFADHAAAEVVELVGGSGGEVAPNDRQSMTAQLMDPSRHANEVSPEFLAQLRLLAQTLMWAHVGIVRSNRRLRQALREVDILRHAVDSLYATSRVSSELLELRNIIQNAWLIITSSLRRPESRGLNTNSDYPEKDDEHCLHDTVLSFDEMA